MIDMRAEDKYILIETDYFTRMAVEKVLGNKTVKGVVETIGKWIDEGGAIEEIITDNGKEFTSVEFRKMCSDKGIRHNTVGVELHRSNGRVERIIGSLREALMKDDKGTLDERVKRIIEAYNNTYQTVIGCTPVEACLDATGQVVIANSSEGRYAKRFRKGPRENFEAGKRVQIAKRESLVGKPKEFKRRFLEISKVLYKCGNDSYLVRKNNGEMIKKDIIT
ncbi:hypothetical protein PAEPH01_0048 [Pancytospora epiphaga]|nr:hypothetical protein PAEPH01_0048 [Pancytospora epiphaga]